MTVLDAEDHELFSVILNCRDSGDASLTDPILSDFEPILPVSRVKGGSKSLHLGLEFLGNRR